MSELKPCPFCGKPAYYDWNNDGNAKDLGCSDDDCAGHLVFSIWHTDIGTKHESEAIEAWNKRGQCQEVERLKKAATDFVNLSDYETAEHYMAMRQRLIDALNNISNTTEVSIHDNALEKAARLADKSAFDEITGLAEQIRALKGKQ